jgi:hypothetical protein
MTEPRIAPIDRNGVLLAFAKLLVPRPVVYVFRALHGWQYAAVEMPDTYQIILGVSAELWHYIGNAVMEQTGRHVEDYVTVQHFPNGNVAVIHLPQPISVVPEDGSESWGRPPVLELAPKPIGAR